MNNIKKAIEFATEKHKDQKRKVTNEKYINHPINVYGILSSQTKDEDILVAGILHDTIEDTDTTYDEINGLFGRKIADLVQECTKPFDTLHSKSALMIKIADMLDNVSDQVSDDWIKRHCKAIREARRVK